MENFALTPILDRVVVKRDDKESASAGGIILSAGAQDIPMFGTVMAVGPGDGYEMLVKPGDRVLFGQFVGHTVKHEGETYQIMHENAIMAVVEA